MRVEMAMEKTKDGGMVRFFFFFGELVGRREA